MTAAGGAMSAYAALQAGRYNKSALDFKAREAVAQAQEAKRAGDVAAGRQVAKGLILEGQAKGAMAGAGTVVGAGTNRVILDQSEAANAIDVATIRANAVREAYGYSARALAYREEGAMTELAGKEQAVATGLNTMNDEFFEADATHEKRLRF